MPRCFRFPPLSGYRINDLLPGAYTVTAQHDGFQAVTVSPTFVRKSVEFGISSLEPDFGQLFGKAFSVGDPRRMQFASRFDF
jgi:hypothetical protein